MPLRKNFYVPGVISLLALCPLLMYQLERWKAFERYYTIEVNWLTSPPDAAMTRGAGHKTVKLSGNPGDIIKINDAKNLVRLMADHDRTMKLLRFQFTGTAKFESFVQVLAMCTSEPSLVCVLYQDDCWVYNRQAARYYYGID